MGARAALTAGTVLSLAAAAVWSFTATLTIGPDAPPHLTRDLPGDYMRLAAAPTGNAAALFTVVAVIYALCLLACSGWRQHRQRVRGGG
jgi:ABC-type molybdate transport system permease subunit